MSYISFFSIIICTTRKDEYLERILSVNYIQIIPLQCKQHKVS